MNRTTGAVSARIWGWMLVLATAAAMSARADNRVGEIVLDGNFALSSGIEMQIREPSMCDGSAKLGVRWNRDANRVWVGGRFDGLPYRPDFCYDYDPSTPWNTWPECVEDGVWQIWFVGRFFTKTSTFWYDGVTGDLLYNEHDVPPEGVPADAIASELPVVQMVCTETFESDPDTLVARERFSFDYDRILDPEGTAGVYVTVLPRNLDVTEDITLYYTEGGLPASEAMHMDDVLDDLDAGIGGLLIATSLEPDPKPDYLLSRDNIMIGWGADYPVGFAQNPLIDEQGECGTFQWEGF